jgi:hypothetical protein
MLLITHLGYFNAGSKVPDLTRIKFGGRRLLAVVPRWRGGSFLSKGERSLTTKA